MQLTLRTLGEICDEVNGIIRTGPFGSQLHESDYIAQGTPVIMPKNIIEGKISVEDIAYIGEYDVKRLKHHILYEGDIVYGRRGDIGRRAFITRKEKGWLCGTGCLRISLGKRILNPHFLYYFLGQPTIIKWIANQAVGATLPNLNTSIIRSIQISYPDLLTQRKIAAILSAYDDLIENNTRRIAILEEMAQSLYREWFVHFRFPAHEKNEMVPSALGMIPKGWEVVKMNSAVNIDPHTKVAKEGKKPFVQMNCLTNNSMLIESFEYRTGNSGSKFKNGDTLFARITPCVENGKTAYVQFLPSNEATAFGSTEFIVLRSRTVSPEYVYLMARSHEFRDNAIKSMSGASGRQRVQVACFDKFLIAQPDTSTLSEFTKLVSPMFRNIQNLSMKNTNLRRTRDLLLPKLISGELDVEALDIETGNDDTESEPAEASTDQPDREEIVPIQAQAMMLWD